MTDAPDIQLGTAGVLTALVTLVACALAAGALAGRRRAAAPGAIDARLGCIDGLRGYLALGVFLHHFVITYYWKQTGIWAPPPHLLFANLGPAAVALFFMVTGFLFVNRILTRRAIDWTNLYVSRVCRLTPLYWFAVLLVVGIAFAKGGGLRDSPALVAKDVLAWLSFFGNPPVNQFQDTNLIIAGVTWTLRYEWVFYLALPILAWMLVPVRWWALAAGVAVVGYGYRRAVEIPWSGLNARFFVLFVVGGVAAAAYRVPAWRALSQHRATSVVALAALLTRLCGVTVDLSPFALVLLAVFFIPVALGNSLFGILRLNGSILLGDVSYSLYLLHGIVLYAVFSLAFPRYLQSVSGAAQLWPWMPVLGLAIVGVALFSHSMVEAPGMALGKAVIARRDRDKLAAAAGRRVAR